jgi:hypothetical protein
LAVRYQITPNHRLSITESEEIISQNLGAGICPIGCQTGDVSKNNAQISEVWTISPRMTNEVRFGYTNQLNFFNLTLDRDTQPSRMAVCQSR